MVVRGVPYRLAKDGWWLDDADPPSGTKAWPLWVAVVILADAMLWQVAPGLGVFILFAGIAAALTLTLYRGITSGRAILAGVILLAGLVPLIEVFQFGTVVVALIALYAAAAVFIAEDLTEESIFRAALRVPGFGLVQTVRDGIATRVAAPSASGMQRALNDWAIPAVVGVVFLLLFASANPLIDGWLEQMGRFDLDRMPDTGRVALWALIGLGIWPLLRLPAFADRLNKKRENRLSGYRFDMLSDRSILRALLVFNLMFGMQTVLDVSYLWGGVRLPEGMTYAEYAHQGAYPLIVVALLAGVFALIAQPFMASRLWVRGLLMVWIGQTVILVLSSILRLDLYIEVYGLTQWRVAGLVWMVVTALGLVLIVIQMHLAQSRGWFLRRAFGLGLLAIYTCNMVNIDGLVARHNLAVQETPGYYICRLGEGAAPAMRAYELKTGTDVCGSRKPYVTQPGDWREWGYRNMRMRRSLAAMEGAQ